MNPGRRAIGLALGATPNPFSISTELAYELPATGAIRVAVYDALGRAVAELARGAAPAGRHVVAWDGRDARGRRLPAGAYFIRIQHGARIESRKVLLAR
jgi:flagellar hook assembly protein FlgD